MSIMSRMNRFLSLTQGDAAYTFLPTGDVFTFKQGHFLINQLRGNAKDGSVNNIYLRIHTPNGPISYPCSAYTPAAVSFITKKPFNIVEQLQNLLYCNFPPSKKLLVLGCCSQWLCPVCRPCLRPGYWNRPRKQYLYK